MAKERKNRRAYLNDFVADENGKYSYRGAHYVYVGEGYRPRMLAMLALLLAAAALLVVNGCIPAPGMDNCFYVILPYVASIVSVGFLTYSVISFGSHGEKIREYAFKKTGGKIHGEAMTAIASSALTLFCFALYLILNGTGGQTVSSIIYIGVQVASSGCVFAIDKIYAKMTFERRAPEPLS